MTTYLRQGSEPIDDYEENANDAPQIDPTVQMILDGYAKQKKAVPKAVPIKKQPIPIEPVQYTKEPQKFKCDNCGQKFTRAVGLTKHINELRCIKKREDVMGKQKEIDAREQRLRDLENEMANKLLKAQAMYQQAEMAIKMQPVKEVKPRKPRTVKPKPAKPEPEAKPLAPPPQQQPSLAQPPRISGIRVNF